MNNKLKRDKAVEKLAKKILKKLNQEQRAEQLHTMLSESWYEDKNWLDLPIKIRQEFENSQLMSPINSKEYDKVLMIWLKYELEAVSNDYICKELNLDKIDGSPVNYEACPCCGYKTIKQRGHCNICMVCWWEDDGQDNIDADQNFDVCNEISLLQARINFLQKGFSDSCRKDLIKLKHNKNRYVQGRFFEFIENKYIIEKGTDWKKEILKTQLP